MQPGVHAALSRRRSRVQIPSGPPPDPIGHHDDRTWSPGRVAQLVERAPEKREVTGSTPVPTTGKEQLRGYFSGARTTRSKCRAHNVPTDFRGFCGDGGKSRLEFAVGPIRTRVAACADRSCPHATTVRSLLEGVVRICSRTPSDAAMTAWLGKPTRGAEQRAIGHGVAVRQGFSASAWCAGLRDGEARSPWEAAGGGGGRSRRRHRPPSPWIIEGSPISPAPLTLMAIRTHPRPKWPAARTPIVGSAQPEPSRRRAEWGEGSLSWGVSKIGIRKSQFITRAVLRSPR